MFGTPSAIRALMNHHRSKLPWPDGKDVDDPRLGTSEGGGGVQSRLPAPTKSAAMSIAFHLQPVQVAADPNAEGRLVFADERLVAVLVRLSEDYESEAGEWYIEAAFGPGLGNPLNPMFANL